MGPQLRKGVAIDLCCHLNQFARIDLDPRRDDMDVEDGHADSNRRHDVMAPRDLALLARVPELFGRRRKRFFFAAFIHGSGSHAGNASYRAWTARKNHAALKRPIARALASGLGASRTFLARASRSCRCACDISGTLTLLASSSCPAIPSTITRLAWWRGWARGDCATVRIAVTASLVRPASACVSAVLTLISRSFGASDCARSNAANASSSRPSRIKAVPRRLQALAALASGQAAPRVRALPSLSPLLSLAVPSPSSASGCSGSVVSTLAKASFAAA